MISLTELERRLRKAEPYGFGPRELSRHVPPTQWTELCRMLGELVDGGRLAYCPEVSGGCSIPRFRWPEGK
jgi:hypothetical protein